MNSPLVSVIVPNYNHARFLDERLQSILNQTYQNFELIILDDKSTDNSIEIIEKYKNNPHISHIIVNEENSGSPFRQWNKGFQFAKGEIIWIAESDDSCSPLFLERLVPIHCSENAVLTFCRSQRMNEQGRLFSTCHNELTNDFVWDGMAFIEKYLGKYNIVTNASSALFNKNVIPLIPKDYLNFKGAGDWLFWIELSRKGKVAFSSESLNYFRYHNTNTTNVCYQNGDNYYEGKKINDYLYKEGLISKSTFYYNIRMNITKLQNRRFESETIRDSLLKVWGYNNSYKIKEFISKCLNKLDWLIW